MLQAAAQTERAPAGLRAEIDSMHAQAAKRRRRRAPALPGVALRYASFATTAVAAAAVALVLALGGGGGLSIAQAASLCDAWTIGSCTRALSRRAEQAADRPRRRSALPELGGPTGLAQHWPAHRPCRWPGRQDGLLLGRDAQARLLDRVGTRAERSGHTRRAVRGDAAARSYRRRLAGAQPHLRALGLRALGVRPLAAGVVYVLLMA